VVGLELCLKKLLENSKKLKMNTVDSLITHTPRWTAQGMGYEGVWALRAEPKISFKKLRKNQKKLEEKFCVFIAKKKCYQ
jgi:hypothetical protein